MVMAQSLVLPYCGLIMAGSWVSRWNFDPFVLGIVAALAVSAWRAPVANGRWGWAATAMVVLLWISPLCPWSATLLSLRVAHHMGVMLVLAPALALAWPRMRIGSPTGWAMGSALALSAWFVPAVYSFAWASTSAYWALQLVMLGAAWQFWATWFAPESARRPLELASAPALLAMAMGLVGALLTFATRPLLAEHIWASAQVDVSPLRDQQLAGLVMWTGGMVPMALFAVLGLRNLIRRTGEGARC